MWFDIVKTDADEFINSREEIFWSLSHYTEYPPRVAMKWLLETIENVNYASIEGGKVILKPSWLGELTDTKKMYIYEITKIAITELSKMYKGVPIDELPEKHFNSTNLTKEKAKTLFYIQDFYFYLERLKDNPYLNIKVYVTLVGKSSNSIYSEEICIVSPRGKLIPTADHYVGLIHLINNKEYFLGLWG